MFKIQKFSVLSLMVGAIISSSVLANVDEKKFNDDASYAVGVLLGSNIKDIIDTQKEIIKYDNARLLAGVEDVLAGKTHLGSNTEVVNTLQLVQDKIQQAQEKELAKVAKQAKEEGDKYRAEFEKKAGVKKTKSGLLYRIEKSGQGTKIGATDLVTVNYTGKLPNGQVFDSSNGKPISFKLNQVVPGWTEGLQLIKKGGKIELVLPPELAYGSQGAGMIPPDTTLYFDVEVVDVKSEEKK
ncbi:FKBP-type peptidyl-prolyl cis-trans isomerase [Pasteurella canis]|uniref:FKBP-type peptidyl-prolyl cis-trans isomerase n=1 Tax=Pasteurella canis TaxID=753 RepID=UPI0006695C3B|nr:FKBP-type peptidyl-prolyl cis-trans isomerase [Pasteurella canis]UAY77627.1 FKBP-type peptidyl-prolyl cis-trans isomerase [Pasteurella canis]UDW83648.1 FKBP-type peptidyl-prolyl cis-trans isomerase [Pasteurella canis]GJJ81073.1 putative FKBP-type peptidyl-prolyl cis-trans isomerase [Pasteurella canis]